MFCKETEQKELAECFLKNFSINPFDVKSGQSFEKLIVSLLPVEVVKKLEKTPTGILTFGFKELSLLINQFKLNTSLPEGLLRLLVNFNLFLKLKKEITQLKKTIKFIDGDFYLFFNLNLYGATTGRITTQNYPVLKSTSTLETPYSASERKYFCCSGCFSGGGLDNPRGFER